jgi:hypothetical protein
MNIRLKQISALFLFFLGMANASASAGSNRRHEQERVYLMQTIAVDRGGQRDESQMQMQGERNRGREFGPANSSGYGNQGENSSNNSNDNSRKHGKMTPEERRALRRQIDEAGHDIYPPKR